MKINYTFYWRKNCKINTYFFNKIPYKKARGFFCLLTAQNINTMTMFSLLIVVTCWRINFLPVDGWYKAFCRNPVELHFKFLAQWYPWVRVFSSMSPISKLISQVQDNFNYVLRPCIILRFSKLVYILFFFLSSCFKFHQLLKTNLNALKLSFIEFKLFIYRR